MAANSVLSKLDALPTDYTVDRAMDHGVLQTQPRGGDFRLFLFQLGFKQLDPFALEILNPGIGHGELISGFSLFDLRPQRGHPA